jgi:gliding motility-associated-like protein
MLQREVFISVQFFTRFWKIILLLLFTINAKAQEICVNGMDDDKDGLADLYAPDCNCHWKAPYNLLKNPSFEEFKHCLTPGAPYLENFDIADQWLFGVRPFADIAFYRNLKCPMDSIQFTYTFLPRPVPDGTGFLVMTRGVTRSVASNELESKSQKYYVSQCLENSLAKDKNYTFSFYGSAYRNINQEKYALDSFTVAVFGNSDCSAIPFGEQGKGNGCPSNFSGWVMLGKTTFVSPYSWVQAKIDLRIPKEINVIQVGADCSLVEIGDQSQGGDAQSKPYYFLDNFELAETKDFNFQYIQQQTGDACKGGYVLKAPTSANAVYQWYKDSIALVGETDSLLIITEPSVNAYYNVRISDASGCKISEPLLLKGSILSAIQIPSDTSSCNGDTLRLGTPLPGVNYSWNGKKDTIVTINQTGQYTITASDILGCTRSFIVNATIKDCIACTVFVPNVFTPNDDGKNDKLKGHTNCTIKDYQLEVYNRWGQKLFVTNTISEAWDGNFSGKQVPNGVYVYFVRFKNSSNEKNYKIVKGTIAIIR